MIYIFSYQRKEMLEKLLKELKDEKPMVLDDGSEFVLDYEKFIKFPHGGKENFYQLWQNALYSASNIKDDFYMFLPSDFSNLDLGRIYEYYNLLRHEPFVCNIINDGRPNCWNFKKNIKISDEFYQSFFTDCGFFCNRQALEKIDFHMPDIPKTRFKHNKNISSGVGQYLTHAFNKAKVKIYTPVKSLAYHGEHDSLMHPELRKRIKLVSK